MPNKILPKAISDSSEVFCQNVSFFFNFILTPSISTKSCKICKICTFLVQKSLKMPKFGPIFFSTTMTFQHQPLSFRDRSYPIKKSVFLWSHATGANSVKSWKKWFIFWSEGWSVWLICQKYALICSNLTELTTFGPDLMVNYAENDLNSYTLPGVFEPNQPVRLIGLSVSKNRLFLTASSWHVYKVKMMFKVISSRSAARSESILSLMWIHKNSKFQKVRRHQIWIHTK